MEHTTLYCDHKPLQIYFKKGVQIAKILRWQEILSEYQIDVVYLKGKDNAIADHLSRTDWTYIKRNSEWAGRLENGLFEGGNCSVRAIKDGPRFIEIPGKGVWVKIMWPQVLLRIQGRMNHNYMEMKPMSL